MGGLLSGISGYFSKYLILGTFLPMVIFAILSWLLVVPLLPADWPVLKPLETLDLQWRVLGISFLTIVGTGFLFNVNIPLIRLYEGYPWKDLWIGKKRADVYRRRFRIAQAQWAGMFFIEAEMNAKKKGSGAPVQAKRMETGRLLFNDFPEREELVLPTLLGNVIRSAESYAQRQYRMEAATFWPRLVAKIDKDYAAAIEETKASFDFMLNCSVLSTLLAFIILLSGLTYPAHFNAANEWPKWFSEIIGFVVLACFFYSLAIGRARAWGSSIRTAFDLYRLDLLRQFGYTRVPETLEEERRIWSTIGQRLIVGDYYLVPPAEYGTKPTFASSQAGVATLEVLRGVGAAAPDEASAKAPPHLKITISVKNTGKYNATGIVVTDTLPNTFAYKWNSAALVNPDDPHALVVSGTNPFHFSVGKLNRNNQLQVTYQAIELTGAGSTENSSSTDESSLLLLNADLLTFRHRT